MIDSLSPSPRTSENDVKTHRRPDSNVSGDETDWASPQMIGPTPALHLITRTEFTFKPSAEGSKIEWEDIRAAVGAKGRVASLQPSRRARTSALSPARMSVREVFELPYVASQSKRTGKRKAKPEDRSQAGYLRSCRSRTNLPSTQSWSEAAMKIDKYRENGGRGPLPNTVRIKNVRNLDREGDFPRWLSSV